MFVNELEKVISSANRETIEVEDINEIVGRTREDSVNDLQDAVSQRNFEKAAFFLKELLGQGEHHLYLLQSIIGQMRRLILIKEFIGNELEGKWNPRMNSDAFKKFIYFPIILRKKREKEEKEKGIVEREGRKGKSSLNVYRLPPDVLLKLCKGAENFTLEDLYGALEMLGEADVKFKSSRVPPALILEEILMGVCFK
jgi:DNA polymerase III delta subunit